MDFCGVMLWWLARFIYSIQCYVCAGCMFFSLPSTIYHLVTWSLLISYVHVLYVFIDFFRMNFLFTFSSFVDIINYSVRYFSTENQMVRLHNVYYGHYVVAVVFFIPSKLLFRGFFAIVIGRLLQIFDAQQQQKMTKIMKNKLEQEFSP